MLEYTKLKKKRLEFVALTGLTPQEFTILLPAFRRAYERHYPPHKTLAGRRRQRKVGGGRKSPVRTLEQKLLFVLVYQKTSPLPVVLGAVFEISQSRVNRWVHHLLPLLYQSPFTIIREQDILLPHQNLKVNATTEAEIYVHRKEFASASRSD